MARLKAACYGVPQKNVLLTSIYVLKDGSYTLRQEEVPRATLNARQDDVYANLGKEFHDDFLTTPVVEFQGRLAHLHFEAPGVLRATWEDIKTGLKDEYAQQGRGTTLVWMVEDPR